jgi:hypothetical protein
LHVNDGIRICREQGVVGGTPSRLELASRDSASCSSIGGEAHVRVGHWRLVGIGYRTRADQLLAQAARDQHFLAVTEARELRRHERQQLVA